MITFKSIMNFRKPAIAFYIGIVLLTTPFFTILFLWRGPDNSNEQLLQGKIAELHERLKHAEMLNKERSRDIASLSRDFSVVLSAANLTVEETNLSDSRIALKSNGKESQVLFSNSQGGLDLQLPSIHHYLPHLRGNIENLQPAFKLSKGRMGATVILGIPTVRRQIQSYLMSTLQNLIENMSPLERNESVIIVFIAELDVNYVAKQAAEIQNMFQEHLESGLLEVIAPPSNFYPEFDKIQKTLGDPLERVKWRTKQNLDFAYLMMYASSKGTFYVQLEDDVLSKVGYVTTMKTYAYKQVIAKKNWFILDFCQLGFIGKLFKCVDLSKLVSFFLMFYNDKPVDWLLDNYIQTKVCRFDKDMKECKKQKDLLWFHYKPSLFQHVGTHSSLKGKVQKLKDKQFGKLQLFHPHKNPPAIVSTTMKAYRLYTLKRAYNGDVFFWSLLPQKNDTILFKFTPPTRVYNYRFRSGNAEHPEDKYVNTSVEVLPVSPPKAPLDLNRTADGYYVVGWFKEQTGLAEGAIPPQLGPINSIRLFIRSNSDHWAILSEILIGNVPTSAP